MSSVDASTAAILARGQQFQGEAAARHIAREFYNTIPEAVACMYIRAVTSYKLQSLYQHCMSMYTIVGGAGGYVIGKLFDHSRDICTKQPNTDQCTQAKLLAVGGLGFVGGFACIRFIGQRLLNDTAPPLQAASYAVSANPGLATLTTNEHELAHGTKLDKHWAL